jgi:YVTN family beta-propeller protein
MMRAIAIMVSAIFLTITQNSLATNLYQYTQTDMLSPLAKQALFRVYVPNSDDQTVSVINPITYQVINTFRVGANPQHVVPAYDLKTLYVLNDKSNSVTPIDPNTGNPGNSIPVDDPYNLYFTPDGQFAIVVCEAFKKLEFLDPHTLKLEMKLPVKCAGANHMDFTADGKYAIVTCEYSGELMKVDVKNPKVVGYLSLGSNPLTTKMTLQNNNFLNVHVLADGSISIDNHPDRLDDSMPQDIRASADGSTFYVADMMKDGVVLIDPVKFTQIGFIHTGIGTHAVYPSRDGKLFYVSNRGCHHMACAAHGQGSVAVIDPVAKKVIATWSIPQGGSPDMGGVTADGKELWLSGRYDSEVYVFDTTRGKLAHRISVGKSPHGLLVWPQPGRYSLGHTGNMR